MVTRSSAHGLIAVLAGESRGQPESEGLSEEGAAFLAELHSAGWSGHAVANGADITIRRAPLFSAEILNAAHNREALNADQKEALDDVGGSCSQRPGGS